MPKLKRHARLLELANALVAGMLPVEDGFCERGETRGITFEVVMEIVHRRYAGISFAPLDSYSRTPQFSVRKSEDRYVREVPALLLVGSDYLRFLQHAVRVENRDDSFVILSESVFRQYLAVAYALFPFEDLAG